MPAGFAQNAFRVKSFKDFKRVIAVCNIPELYNSEIDPTATVEELNEMLYNEVVEFCEASDYMNDNNIQICFANEEIAIKVLTKYAKYLAKKLNTILYSITIEEIITYIKGNEVFKSFYCTKKYCMPKGIIYKKSNIEIVIHVQGE